MLENPLDADFVGEQVGKSTASLTSLSQNSCLWRAPRIASHRYRKKVASNLSIEIGYKVGPVDRSYGYRQV